MINLRTFVDAALKPLAWVCLITVMIASWTPGQEMVRTGFNPRLEHIFAYLVASIAVTCLSLATS
jgi:hypothetical protein